MGWGGLVRENDMGESEANPSDHPSLLEHISEGPPEAGGHLPTHTSR